MRTYQLLTLAGCAFEVLMTIFFFLIPMTGYGSEISNSTVTGSRSDTLFTPHYDKDQIVFVYFAGWFVVYLLFPYVAASGLVLTLERTKIMGAGLIVLAFYTLGITFYINFPGTGFVGFILFLSAGILAIRFKKLENSQ
jgi:hypothetical protein